MTKHCCISFLMIVLGGVCMSQFAFAASPGEPIVELKGVKPKQSVWKAANRKEPIEIKVWETAGIYFNDEQIEKLKQDVDLKKQKLVMFVWRGSGQDRLNYAVLESFPEQIVFEIKPGRTRDLRPHFHLFALRSNVRWSLK